MQSRVYTISATWSQRDGGDDDDEKGPKLDRSKDVKFPIIADQLNSIDSNDDEESQRIHSKYSNISNEEILDGTRIMQSKNHEMNCKKINSYGGTKEEEKQEEEKQEEDCESIVSFSMNVETEQPTIEEQTGAISRYKTIYRSGHSLLGSTRRNFARKGTIFIRTSQHSLCQSFCRQESSFSTVYSPKSCSICLEKYKIDDDICWSKRDSCPHAFHEECLTQWLMRHSRCPLCRETYL